MLAAEIKRLRIKVSLSQKQLADALGVSVRSIKHWEAGTRNISKPVEMLLNTLFAKYL